MSGCWSPKGFDKEMINTIVAMCLDSLQGKGPDTKETFVQNLEMMLDGMKKKDNNPESAG